MASICNSSICSIKWKVLRTLYSSTFFMQFLPLILLFPNPSIFHTPQLSLKFMATFFFIIFCVYNKKVYIHTDSFSFSFSLFHTHKNLYRTYLILLICTSVWGQQLETDKHIRVILSTEHRFFLSRLSLTSTSSSLRLAPVKTTTSTLIYHHGCLPEIEGKTILLKRTYFSHFILPVF